MIKRSFQYITSLIDASNGKAIQQMQENAIRQVVTAECWDMTLADIIQLLDTGAEDTDSGGVCDLYEEPDEDESL